MENLFTKGMLYKAICKYCLLKHLKLHFKSLQALSLRGWTNFLTALSQLNVLLTSVNNTHTWKQYRRFTTDGKEEFKVKACETEETRENSLIAMLVHNSVRRGGRVR